MEIIIPVEIIKVFLIGFFIGILVSVLIAIFINCGRK